MNCVICGATFAHKCNKRTCSPKCAHTNLINHVRIQNEKRQMVAIKPELLEGIIALPLRMNALPHDLINDSGTLYEIRRLSKRGV